LVVLFFLLCLSFFLLHLYLLLNTSYLVTYAHGVRLDLLAHLKGSLRRLGVSSLNHLTHIDLSLGQIHHLKVSSNTKLAVFKVVTINSCTGLGRDMVDFLGPNLLGTLSFFSLFMDCCFLCSNN